MHYLTACARASQDPNRHVQAGLVLLQFRQSARPLPACRHILEHSRSYEAKFYAACTMREAIIREWACMQADEVDGMHAVCMGCHQQIHACIVRQVIIWDWASLQADQVNCMHAIAQGVINRHMRAPRGRPSSGSCPPCLRLGGVACRLATTCAGGRLD